MKRWLILLFILVIPLYAATGSTAEDSVFTKVRPSFVYFPFDLDTLVGVDSITSVWYYINDPELTGYQTYTIFTTSIAGSIKYKIYKEFTNDTSWVSNTQVLVDSITTNLDETESTDPYGSAYMRWKIITFGAGGDETAVKLKFNMK